MRKRRLRGFRPFGEHLDDRCLPSGFTPSQILAAYGLDGISFQPTLGPKVAGDGTGQTIAIVDLYHDPNLQASLDAFDSNYNLPRITLNVINQAGNQSDPGWAEEESLDVEWAHAIAPGASILVVEASPGTTDDQEFNNILAAVHTAGQGAGVSAVSMSWGYDEFPGETAFDSSFTATGVTFIAASGDGGTVSWPATSADVLSIGGTSLNLGIGGAYGSEVGWSSAGGGLSTLATEPAYQKTVQSIGDRSTPDVSLVADPNTGVSMYLIPPDGTPAQGEWAVVGGTSVAAPAWAGIMAIVNQGRALAGLSSLTGATQTLPALYALPTSDFNRVALSTAGSGSNMSINTAGYNTQAGLGSPLGYTLVDSLVNNTTTTPTPTPSPSPSPTPTPTTPPGFLPRPKPIPIPTPTPPPPPVVGPPPAPLPAPTSSPTPPPAPPPQDPPTAVSKHKHKVKASKPTAPRHPHPVIRHRSHGQSKSPGKKAHP